jgi:3-hydroxybutyryl-CoA dehydrogenase
LVAIGRRMTREPVRLTDAPGFLVNQVGRGYNLEASHLVYEGVATFADVDRVMRDVGGFRMGPFELMDLIGHDVNYAVTCSVYEAMYQDPRYKPSLIQKDLVDAGLLGRKSGRGFYSYSGKGQRPAAQQAVAMSAPTMVELEGDLGIASTLIALAREQGISVAHRDPRPGTVPVLLIDGIAVRLTTGATATEQSLADERRTILFDLCRDYRTAPRIALALPNGAQMTDASAVIGFFQKIGKVVSVVDDVPGLVVMRTLAMLVNEAAEAVYQSVTSAADVEIAMVKGVNYPCGPLAWANSLGVAHVHHVMSSLHAYYGDDRYRVSPLLRRLAITHGSFDVSNSSVNRTV